MYLLDCVWDGLISWPNCNCFQLDVLNGGWLKMILCMSGCSYTGVYLHRQVGGLRYYMAQSTAIDPKLELGAYSSEEQAAMSHDHFCIYQVQFQDVVCPTHHTRAVLHHGVLKLLRVLLKF